MLDSLDKAAPNSVRSSVTQQRSKYVSSLNNDDASDAPRLADLAFIVAAEALAQLGSPALVFDCAGRILVANCLIETLTDCLRLRARNTLSFHDPLAEAVFRKAVENLDNKGRLALTTFAARCSGGVATMIARILPIDSRLGKDAAQRVGILVFASLTHASAPPVELLQSLFDLTAAEARVARGLAAGATIDELAATAKVSRNTVRSQLRAIMEKTGCHRQAEAVGLFCRVSLAGGSYSIAAFG